MIRTYVDITVCCILFYMCICIQYTHGLHFTHMYMCDSMPRVFLYLLCVCHMHATCVSCLSYRWFIPYNPDYFIIDRMLLDTTASYSRYLASPTIILALFSWDDISAFRENIIVNSCVRVALLQCYILETISAS